MCVCIYQGSDSDLCGNLSGQCYRHLKRKKRKKREKKKNGEKKTVDFASTKHIEIDWIVIVQELARTNRTDRSSSLSVRPGLFRLDKIIYAT